MSVSLRGQVFLCHNDIAIYQDKDDASLFIAGNIRPHPQPRITRRSRFANKYHKAYIDWRNNMRDLVKTKFQQLYFPDEFLELSVVFGAKPSEATRKNKDGSDDKRTINDIYNSDLANYVKAWEDVMNGIVYKDDKQIRKYGNCDATDNVKDYYFIHLKPVYVHHSFFTDTKVKI